MPDRSPASERPCRRPLISSDDLDIVCVTVVIVAFFAMLVLVAVFSN